MLNSYPDRFQILRNWNGLRAKNSICHTIGMAISRIHIQFTVIIIYITLWNIHHLVLICWVTDSLQVHAVVFSSDKTNLRYNKQTKSEHLVPEEAKWDALAQNGLRTETEAVLWRTVMEAHCRRSYAAIPPFKL